MPKKTKTNFPAVDPTQAEIETRCAAIRAEWSEKLEMRRRGIIDTDEYKPDMIELSPKTRRWLDRQNQLFD